MPYFTDADLTDVSFESYSDLDSLGRCGVAYASVSHGYDADGEARLDRGSQADGLAYGEV